MNIETLRELNFNDIEYTELLKIFKNEISLNDKLLVTLFLNKLMLKNDVNKEEISRMFFDYKVHPYLIFVYNDISQYLFNSLNTIHIERGDFAHIVQYLYLCFPEYINLDAYNLFRCSEYEIDGLTFIYESEFRLSTVPILKLITVCPTCLRSYYKYMCVDYVRRRDQLLIEFPENVILEDLGRARQILNPYDCIPLRNSNIHDLEALEILQPIKYYYDCNHSRYDLGLGGLQPQGYYEINDIDLDIVTNPNPNLNPNLKSRIPHLKVKGGYTILVHGMGYIYIENRITHEIFRGDNIHNENVNNILQKYVIYRNKPVNKNIEHKEHKDKDIDDDEGGLF